MTTVAHLLRASPLDAIDARALLAYALGWRRTELITRADEALNRTQVNAYQMLSQRRRTGAPVAQLTGVREFFGLEFEVTPAVLIPRPETELLVEQALDAIESINAPRVLDLGAGSGAIAIAIAHQRPAAAVTATDCSASALMVAQVNARRLLPLDRPGGPVRFAAGNWYDALDSDERFHAIVSNPPYIAVNDPHLSQGALRFEPRHALTDGANGLSALTVIIAAARAHLETGGVLWVEHGYNQSGEVRALLETHGFKNVHSIRDLAGIERASGGQHNN